MIPTNNIKHKQKEILYILLRFRTISSKQIQLLLHHKNHKRINAWLKELHDKNYIGKHKETRSPGYNIPAIFYLEKNGSLFLKEQANVEKSYLNKMRYEGKKKQAFIDKCVLITNFYIHLLHQSVNDLFLLKFYTQNDFSKKAKIRRLMPSFAYVKEKNGKREQFTGECISEKMPVRALKARIDSYLDYFSDAERESLMHIIFICQNDKKYGQTKRYLKEIMDEDIKNLDIQVTTYERMRKAALGERIEIK